MADSNYQGVWRDGQYLIARNRIATFPERCIACGSDLNSKKLACKIRKRPGLQQVFLWWTAVFSPAVVIKPYLCPKHRKQELKWRWIGHSVLLIAIAMIVIPFVWVATVKHIPNSAVALIPIGTWFLSVWVYYRVFRRRVFHAVLIKGGDAWIQGVHQSVLDLIPELPDSTA